MKTRRDFIMTTIQSGTALGFARILEPTPASASCGSCSKPIFKISLAEWSLNRRIRKIKGYEPLDHLDFAKTAKVVPPQAMVSTAFEFSG